MRIIKFRAWDDIEKKMVYFNLKDYMTIHSLVAYNGEFYVKFHFMQFTGILDKNGKEIYERDIIRAGNSDICTVGWNSRYASFGLTKRGWLYDHYFGEALNSGDCEIIGNRFENPDLARGEVGLG